MHSIVNEFVVQAVVLKTSLVSRSPALEALAEEQGVRVPREHYAELQNVI